MIRISITPAAFQAIASTLPAGVDVGAQQRAAEGYFVWLPPPAVDRLAAMLRPGEDYSDVIVRLAGRAEPP